MSQIWRVLVYTVWSHSIEVLKSHDPFCKYTAPQPDMNFYLPRYITLPSLALRSLRRALFVSGKTKAKWWEAKEWTDPSLAAGKQTVTQWGLLLSHTVGPSGFTMSRTFETPSFTVGIWAAVVLAFELLHTRGWGQSENTTVDVEKPWCFRHENNMTMK